MSENKPPIVEIQQPYQVLPPGEPGYSCVCRIFPSPSTTGNSWPSWGRRDRAKALSSTSLPASTRPIPASSGWVESTLPHYRRRNWPRWRATNVGFIFQFYNLMPVLDRLRKRGTPPAPDRPFPERAARARASGPRHGQPGRPDGSLPIAAFRWPAAAGGHRPGRHYRSDDPGGGRADRRSGPDLCGGHPVTHGPAGA